MNWFSTFSKRCQRFEPSLGERSKRHVPTQPGPLYEEPKGRKAWYVPQVNDKDSLTFLQMETLQIRTDFRLV